MALKRSQCEVVACFSLSPWDLRRVILDELVWDPVGQRSFRAVFNHNLCSRVARESLGMGGLDGLLMSEVPSVDVKAS